MNNQNRNFEEVQGGAVNQQWKPQATEKNGMQFNPNNPDNVKEGYFVETKDIKGQQDRMFTVATIRPVLPDGSFGEDLDVIADTVLNDRLSKISLNSYIRIEYCGRTHKKGYPTNSPWSQTNSYHNWKVAVDKNAVPLDQLMGRTSGNQNTNFNQVANQHQNTNQAQVNQNVFQQANQQFNAPNFNQGNVNNAGQGQVNQNNQGQFNQFSQFNQGQNFNPNQNNGGGGQNFNPNFTQTQNSANRQPVGFNSGNQNQFSANNVGNAFEEDLPF